MTRTSVAIGFNKFKILFEISVTVPEDDPNVFRFPSEILPSAIDLAIVSNISLAFCVVNGFD